MPYRRGTSGDTRTWNDREWFKRGGSGRKQSLPSNWASVVRPRILARDGHRCRHVENGIRCTETTKLQVDHREDPTDHRDSNLWTLCEAHHNAKSYRERQEARHGLRRPRDPKKAADWEPHPGMITR
jgi:5-methylcytosine-specific restriction enzyme A